ncbi:MAG: bifunctional pyr operon transcriptional regulator/uracil phosphoribosyltransferase PyrR [Gammaproteobacteria bacterium]|nr:MAG: bifunctional pyr operon transcriptional regulator/uracil phosphoribosyltransferase PyrR [Gammaproteobacteria bacterium]
MVTGLREFLAARGREEFVTIGIHTGGAWVAQELHRALAPPEPLGTLNIAFYRDDFSRIGVHPSVTPSNLPFEVEDRHVVLVDDVLHTGRTIRAALNEIFDYGRPASIALAVLVERSGRELPIQPDVAGCSLDLAATEHVKLSGPEPLRLELRSGPG